MAHCGTLKDAPIAEAGEDVRGSHLNGWNGEELGKIDGVIFDQATGDIRYVVVGTGGWLDSKKFLVTAERLRASRKHESDFEADVSKWQIGSFPPTPSRTWSRRASGKD